MEAAIRAVTNDEMGVNEASQRSNDNMEAAIRSVTNDEMGSMKHHKVLTYQQPH